MRCALATIGSRGDVEPFVLLASALAERGHAVTLALDVGHHALPALAAAGAGVAVTALGELAATALVDAVARAVAAVTPEERSRIGHHAFMGRRQAELRARLIELAGAHDLLVVSDALACIDGGRLPWRTPTAMLWYTLQAESEYRRLSAIDCLHLAALPALFGPRDPALAARIHFTGFWRSARAEVATAEVERFLATGAPPLFLTMGSMAGFDAAALIERFLAAGRARGERMIIQKGWAELAAAAADDVLFVDEVAYARLFPRCAALFVHGGTGTMAHALGSGRPIAVLPLVADQVAWARVVAQLGSGIGTIDPRRTEPAAWEEAMRRASDPSVKRAAERIAAQLAAEGGLEVACDHLERALEPAPLH